MNLKNREDLAEAVIMAVDLIGKATRERREQSHDSAKASLDCCLLANRFALGQTGSSRRMTAKKLVKSKK